MRLAAACLLVLTVVPPSVAAASCPDGAPPAALLYAATGTVRVDGTPVAPPPEGLALCAGTTVETGADARATLYVIHARTALQVAPLSRLSVLPPAEEDSGLLALARGAIYFLSRVQRSLRVDTPFVNASIEGTEVVLRVAEADAVERVRMTVLDGAVTVAPAAPGVTVVPGTVVADGQSLVVDPGGTARVERPAAAGRFATLREAGGRELAWTLYYPTILPDPRGPVSEAAAALRAGRADEALRLLEGVPRDSPAVADRDALESVIRLVQGDRAAARRLADAAVERDPDAVAPRLARSWAAQVTGDLDTALADAQRAAELAPRAALARARVAEAHLIRGEVRAARREAEGAVAVEPVPGALAVLGLTALAAHDTAAAEGAFTRALRLDPADPSARLGEGLALIRRGRLAEGRERLEVAAIQDPTRAVLRAQLGRALHEERRDAEAATEFEAAKALDPSDPTPWLYDALRLQQANRPVEALAAAERSIALNDERAPFRAPVLLAEDRAARGAVLGRILRDLGFEQLGLPLASRALRDDPASAAAHRFLADVYAGLPRREVARTSEEFVALLLQGPSADPVLPSRRFTDLAASRLAGSPIGFNEFGRLFDREGVRATVSGLVGNQSTYAAEAAAAAMVGRGSLSVGQFRYDTDGWRENAHVRHDVTNVTARAALTEDVAVLAEFRRRATVKGDTTLAFERDAFSPTLRDEEEENAGRVGLRWDLAPRSTLLATAGMRGLDSNRDDGLVLANGTGRAVEIAHVWRGDVLRSVVGAAHVSNDETTDFFGLAESDSRRQTTAYGYVTGGVATNLDMTVGAAFDDRDSSLRDGSEFSPKLGITWSPVGGLALRAAYVEWEQRDYLFDDTLEPTQVAGFNQLYDDVIGSGSRLYGVGVDANPVQGLYLGVEAARREVTYPRDVDLDGDGLSETIDSSGQENTLTAYASTTIGRRWSVDLRYVYDWYRDGRGFEADASVPRRVATQSVPLTVRWFDPSGWYAKVRATWLRQDVDALPEADGEDVSSSSILLDAGLGYRLPGDRGEIELSWLNLTDERIRYYGDQLRATRDVGTRPIPESTIFLTATLRFGG